MWDLSLVQYVAFIGSLLIEIKLWNLIFIRTMIVMRDDALYKRLFIKRTIELDEKLTRGIYDECLI